MLQKIPTARMLNEACSNQDIDQLKKWVALGGMINDADVYDITPLIQSVQKGWIEGINFLIAQGANIHYKDIYNRFPADYHEKGIEMIEGALALLNKNVLEKDAENKLVSSTSGHKNKKVIL